MTCTTSKKLKIWDIFSEQLIYCMQLDEEIISMDSNAESTLLATVFRGDSMISMWNIEKLTLFEKKPQNTTYATPIRLRGSDKRAYYFGEDNENSEDEDVMDVDEDLFLQIKEHLEEGEPSKKKKKNSKEIRFTSIPSNRWLPLKDIEAIEERNRPN